MTNKPLSFVEKLVNQRKDDRVFIQETLKAERLLTTPMSKRFEEALRIMEPVGR